MSVGLQQYDTHFCYARFNRNMRSLVAFVETIVDYKFRLVLIFILQKQKKNI